MKKEKSCGVIVFQNLGILSVLLVHHNLGHWGIPKGHVEYGETETETALREVFEETGVKVSLLDSFREVITYSPAKNIIKDVVFFLGEPINNNIVFQRSEVCEVVFLPIQDALLKVTHEDEKAVLEKAVSVYLNKNFDV